MEGYRTMTQSGLSGITITYYCYDGDGHDSGHSSHSESSSCYSRRYR